LFYLVQTKKYWTFKAAGKAKVDNFTEKAWAILNSLFTVGGMIGAIGSKYVMDFMGRKNGILFHNLFSISAGVLVLIAPFVHSPVCLLLSRFLFGVQSGATCSITPTYINEISPKNLRGQTGVMPQVCTCSEKNKIYYGFFGKKPGPRF
jgi:MFS family permease